MSEEAPQAALKAVVFEILKTLNDPELGVNIVDLGLVYQVEVKGGDAPASFQKIGVQMTMTSRSCPLGQWIREEAERLIQKQVPGAQVEVELVWTPPWSADKMSDAAKKQLKIS